jgi:hypothetical protein
MPNKNGSVYGLTVLSPIIDDEKATPSHDLQIRNYLAHLSTREESPFAQAPGTHLARLVVMDDVIYVGAPACEEHLKSKYLIFESNCDGDLDGYLGAANRRAFIDYMKACQLNTTFFFAAVNDKSVSETLRALQTQSAVADFIANHQGADSATLQREFIAFVAHLKDLPSPRPGSMGPHRDIKTGGRNE